MGFLPVLRHLGEIADAAKKVKSAIREFNPDVVIPVDFGTFNFKYILPYVHDLLGIPVVYYISPKVWAWKRWRVKILEKYVDTLLCILPFETVFFKPYDIKTVFVGNPCVDAVNNYRVTAQPKLNLNIEQVNRLWRFSAAVAGKRLQPICRICWRPLLQSVA